jgi:cell division septation protein DedD
MQFVDKHDNTVPSSDHWRAKVSPIPTFLQNADRLSLPSLEENDKGNLLMKGILYTILTATIGVLVGYVISYVMRDPHESTAQSLKSLVSESEIALTSPAKPPAQGAAKSTNHRTPAGQSTAEPSAATAPPAPALPADPGATKPAAKSADKPKDASATATPAPAPAAAKKPPVPQGPVFLNGTNPYGPPPLVEQDIFNPSTLLKVEYDSAAAPNTPYAPSTVRTPTFDQLLQDQPPTTNTAQTPKPGFQVQLGAFSSRLNATQFANRLQEKGYQVNIYEGVGRNRGAWYFVRVDKMMDQTMALETAKTIQDKEKFSPMVIQPAETDKKLW